MTEKDQPSSDQKAAGKGKEGETANAKKPSKPRRKGQGGRAKPSRSQELPGRGQVDWDALDEDPTLHFEKSAWVSSRRRKPQTTSEKSKKKSGSRNKALETPNLENKALVLSVGAKRCTADLGGRRIDCRLPSALAARQRFGLAVGDLVEVSRQRGAWWVGEVLPRRTELARVDPKDTRQRKVIAANIDVVVVVAGVRKPGLKTGLLDRYLLAVESSGADILICLNKIDLAMTQGELQPDDPELEALEPYRRLGHSILFCSASTGQGIQELLTALEGKTCVLVGHSGVGKSSLLNALKPDLNLAALSVRHSDGTGRHTTTRSNLYRIGNNTRIIDTPGVRELGLWDTSANEVRNSFPELLEASKDCRFSNCTHTHEPGCGVKVALEQGKIPAARYEAYLRILSSVE